ncbi:helix-turn-helix transcriptional regulator [Gordonia araii]|nr:LuxR C-terminal-related transcriptional regulator [Gordonia araii]NNG97030.1 hypothetical protein [Gordonia araii NBRC 100433]
MAAPPGHGKTVAARQWQTDVSSIEGWVSLAHKIDTSAELARWITTALCQNGADLTRALSIQAQGFAQLTTAIQSLACTVTLVIDDAHRAVVALADPEVQAFLRHVPKNLKLLLVGHGELVSGLSRLIMHDDAKLLGGGDLAFDTAEVTAVAASRGIELSDADAASLQCRTGGWPIAVRSTLASEDPALVTDYIAENVLAMLPADLRDFVLATTTTETVDAELAHALTGRPDAAEMIEHCRGRSLFLDRFDDPQAPDRAPIYRWHNLFARGCREILATRDRARGAELHRAAARHLRKRSPVAAAQQANLGSESALAYAIVVDEWLPAVIGSQGGDLDQVCQQLRSSLDGHITREPYAVLAYIQACCRDVAGDRVGAAALRAEAQRHLPDDPSWRALLVRDLAAMICSDNRLEIEGAATRTAATIVGDSAMSSANTDSMMRICALFITGWSELRLRRNPRLAADLLTAARTACATEDIAGARYLAGLERWIRANEVFALAASGQFTAATAPAKVGAGDAATAVDTSASDDTWASYDSGIEAFANAFSALWQGRLVSALQMLTELSPIDDARDGYQPLARVHRVLAAVALGDSVAIADAEAGLALIPTTDSHGVAWSAFTALAQARIAESRGERDTVLEIVDLILQDPRSMPALNATLAAACIRLGAPERAPDLLARVDRRTLPPYIAVAVHVAEALFAESVGDRSAADAALRHALTAAAPEQVRYPFVDGGDPALAGVLSRYDGAHEAFVAECLAVRGRYARFKGGTDFSLTRREAELVGLLRSQMSMAEIASLLHISENTLNSHRKSLYRKLGASNRREALRLANAIGA